jgi:hypothetical protein
VDLGCVKTRRRRSAVEKRSVRPQLRTQKIRKPGSVLVDLRNIILATFQIFAFLRRLGQLRSSDLLAGLTCSIAVAEQAVCEPLRAVLMQPGSQLNSLSLRMLKIDSARATARQTRNRSITITPASASSTGVGSRCGRDLAARSLSA